MYLKKAITRLAAAGAIAAGVAAPGAAYASTSPTVRVAAQAQPAVIKSFVYGFYSTSAVCAVVSGGALASNSAYVGALCQNGHGAPTPWALIIYYEQ